MDKKPLTKESIIELLKDEKNQQDVENFAAYCIRTKLDVDKKTNKLKNPWMQQKDAEQLASLFKRVANDGLVFDGVHVTLQSTGISYDYIAYKNKMLNVYPDSIIDIQLVYKGDTFQFEKKNGQIVYNHKIANPFEQKDSEIAGGYCVIKNKRGEFLTTLSPTDIEKHRKVAKTDYIWKMWFKEMCLKTIMKKSCKMHFADVFSKMEEEDNTNYDVEKPINIELEWKQEIEAINTFDELREYYLANKGRGADFAKMITQRKKEITEAVMPKQNETA